MVINRSTYHIVSDALDITFDAPGGMTSDEIRAYLQANSAIDHAVIAAIDLTEYEIEQADRAAARDDRVQEALFAITARRTQIDNDLTALAAATTLAATRPIIQRLLNAESQTLLALGVVIRALRRLA